MSHTDDLIAAAEHHARHFEGDPNSLTIALNAFYAGAHWQEKRDEQYAKRLQDALGSLQELLAKQIAVSVPPGLCSDGALACAACGWINDTHSDSCPVDRGLKIIDAALATNPNPSGRNSAEAMILHLGSVPADRDVDHFRCKERRCVNTAHLRLATENQNALENNESPFARNKRKTHCKYGHPLSGDNIRLTQSKSPTGATTTNRLCLACYGPRGIRKTKGARA